MELKNKQKSSIKLIIILSVFIIGLQSISVPISTEQYRCMVVYSSSSEQNVKIDVRFPKFEKQEQHDEYFVIWVNNTETFHADFYRVEPGDTFRRQLDLQPSKSLLIQDIMYKVCFRVNTTSNRQIGPVDVEYESYHQFRIMNNNRHNIKVPQQILKQNDLKQCYNDAQIMLDITQRQLELNKMHKKDEQRHFQIINKTTTNLVWISVIEVVFIFFVAVVQFYVIKKHLSGDLKL